MPSKRKRKKPQRRLQKNWDLSSTSDSTCSLKVNKDKKQCVSPEGKQRKVDNKSENKSDMENDTSKSDNSINTSSSLQFPPSTSTPGMNFQPFPQFNPYPPFPLHPPPMSLEPMLKELCQKMSNIENKLSKLDNIETRLNSMEAKFRSYDSDISMCKARIDHLEQSAQFLSDVHDEQASIKVKLNSISNRIDVSKEVESRLLDIETKNLQQNLLFFAIDEKHDEKGGGNGNENADANRDENCVEVILDFCENKLKIENAKTKVEIAKAYRLGKPKNDKSKSRPIVAEFSKFSDREMVRNSSKQLKGTKFGISPQFPKEVLDRRKKLIPIMKRERGNKKNAYLIGDKLYVDGELWKG